MAELRSVVITGAARGLGFASAVRLYHEGWQVVAAMRTPDRGMPLLRAATGASEDDDRLIGVQLDLTDTASVSACAKAIEERIGAPYAVVHNAGISSAGMAEETDVDLWQRMFATHVIGPVLLTNALLPSMRAAGEGRIVMVCSSAGVRGQPATAPYSASKGAMERWGESLAAEIAPFGLGVTILITGTYDTEIITDAGTTDDRDFSGPYARLHQTMDTRGRFAMKLARSPERFADGLVKALTDRGPFRRHGVGPDASMLLISNRLLPPPGMHHLSRIVLGIPRQGSMRGGAYPLTAAQKAMVLAMKVIPQPVMQRLIAVAAKRAAAKQPSQQTD
ncbi:SDR family oxidoreductase [Mycolicibacterium sp. Dal123E01]|uniref:SDR family oxidoreductase n=1 Tax=Mycolicibacterium sp. Dal123E01 TaxID=3457578 RepID=UPI00403EF181